jgi:hypothetical protein
MTNAVRCRRDDARPYSAPSGMVFSLQSVIKQIK